MSEQAAKPRTLLDELREALDSAPHFEEMGVRIHVDPKQLRNLLAVAEAVHRDICEHCDCGKVVGERETHSEDCMGMSISSAQALRDLDPRILGEETEDPESCPHEITDEECTVGTIAVAPNARPTHPCRRCSRCGNWVPRWIWEQILGEEPTGTIEVVKKEAVE